MKKVDIMKRINLGKKDMTSIFSELEKDILNFIWKNKEAKSSELYSHLKKRHKIAHSSVAVTLNRLYKKGILTRKPERTRGGVRYIYSPKLTKGELGTEIAYKFVDFLRKTFGEPSVINLKKKIRR